MLLPVSASATVFSGSKADPAGDGPSPDRDVTRARVTYDDQSGKFEFAVRLAAAPSAGMQVTAGVGRRNANGCGTPLLVLATVIPGDTTIWLIEENGANPAEHQDYATRTVSGQVLKMTATDPRLKGYKPDCAEAILSDPANSSNLFDHVTTFGVKPPPPRPRIKVKFGKVGSMLRGSSRTVKVRVTNQGTATARKVTLRMKGAGAVKIRPGMRKLGSIRPGKTRVAGFRIQARGKGRAKLTARAKGKKTSARASTAFKITRPAPPPPPATGGLAGEIFWGFESYNYYRSQELVFLHFTSRKFVRWGIPKGGLKSCGRVTAKMKDGEMQPGCLRYSYNKRNGQVRIGKVRGTFRGGKLKLKMNDGVWTTKGEVWYRGLTARPGARFHTMLINRGYTGCGVNPYCTTWKENLTLTRNGKFGRQDSSLSTGGGIGTGLPFVGISQLGPNERGRYKVLRGGKIRFNFADGKKVTETLVVQTDKRGRPDPVREGLLVDDVWFYKD